MKIQGNDFVFINSNYLKICDYNDKNELISIVKRIIIKLKSKLELNGFYKLRVYVNKKIGLFVDIIKLDDVVYSNDLDLRVIIFLDEDIYIGVDDYFLIKDYKNIRFYKDKYYINVMDIDNVYELVEFGEYIYGDSVLTMLNNSLCI